jgi:hypothetical protein
MFAPLGILITDIVFCLFLEDDSGDLQGNFWQVVPVMSLASCVLLLCIFVRILFHPLYWSI